ncbi:MAG: GNAT family N-acetyltransferase [Chloroflexi bacterium]|nr:GNAT family N-acetyltransferase [Chloroflexota bacterium]
MLGTRLRITPYERQHRRALLDLSFTSHWTHKHLDWHTTGQWLDNERGPVFLAWQGDALTGYIGFSRPIAGCSWIRLLGIGDGRMPGQIVADLWQGAQAQCGRAGIRSVVILATVNWLPAYMSRLDFEISDEIITMSHIGSRTPQAPSAAATLRPAEIGDIARLCEIDRLAFTPHWRMSRSDFRQALRIAAEPTVAVHQGEVVAYQFSTRHDAAGHLARLAVHPAWQRRGIASLLVRRLLDEMRRRDVETLTVNTQASNHPSQRLYQRHGFFRNGYDLGLWRNSIAKSGAE